MFDKLEAVIERYDYLTNQLADPSIYDRQEEFKKISSERASLEEIVETYKKYKKIKEDVSQAKDLAINESDPELKEMAKEEVSEGEKEIEVLEDSLRILLLPKDPLDDKDVMLEIRAGAGGDEASIFAADVMRMYQNYFKELGFKCEIISVSKSDEGLKEVIMAVTGEKVYSKLKYESGVHRVQRVPKTESQGRVHTSTITVAVMPEADEVEFELDMNDVRIDVYRAGGHGGQSVNTTDSAVRATHIPTGTAVAIQDEKSQHKNKDKALKILRARIYDKMVQEAQAAEAEKRRGLVGRGDRSERIRTYNFPQGRLTDHRINLTLYSLDRIIEGELGPVTDALITHNQTQLLQGEEE
ncbi:MAG: peptide chain release factor 1 [Halobacteriovoraceae bacterium]|nr:peptide chain release factor 1 [Halobacteriovoraceae bacterium]MCB9095633.1 peptide chain release factor 1 [Halobacteriovoraceae bacterium]